MSVSTSSSQIDDERLVRAVHEYLESLEHGPRVDRHQFVEQHAEIADALEGCLDAIDIVEGCLPHFAPSDDGDPPHDELDVGDRRAQRLPQLQLGDYRILRRIGQGGMGVVYEAKQLSLERHVALKILPFAAMLDPRSLKRFHTEAVAAASLDHPHIVGIHSVGCERGIHYYAMQLIPGRSLAEVIRDRQTSLTDDDNRSPQATDTQPFASLSTQHDDPRERHSHAVGPSTLSISHVGSPNVSCQVAHADEISSIAFSPDGALLASAGLDCKARLWSIHETATSIGLEEERVFTHRNQLYAVAFSPDGRYLAAGGYNYETRLWDLKTGELAKSLRSVGHSVTSIAFGADGDTLITGGRDNCASVWDLETGRRHQVVRSHTLDVTSVARSRDGALLVTGSNDGTARLWPISPLEAEDEQGAYDTPIGFVPGTRQMVVGCDSWGPLARDFDCGGVRVFDLMAGQVLSMGRPDEAVTTLAVAPENNILVPGGGLVATSGHRVGESIHKVHLWNSQTGQLLKAIDVPGNRLAFSPDGGQLAIATGDERLLIWDLATSKARWDLDVGQSFSSLAYTPDGRELWLGFRKSLVSNKLWRGGEIERRSAATGELLQTLRGHDDFVWSIAFSPDGNRVATASLDKTIRVWDRDNATPRLTLSGHTMFVLSVAFSPDGRTLASGSGDGTVRLWDPQTGDELATLRCQSGVDSVAFSHDGKTLAAGHTDQSVSVWHSELQRQSWPRSFR